MNELYLDVLSDLMLAFPCLVHARPTEPLCARVDIDMAGGEGSRMDCLGRQVAELEVRTATVCHFLL